MDELEMVEFEYPSVFAKGTKVKVIKVTNMPCRTFSGKITGYVGTVMGHRTRHDYRWNRVEINGGLVDFLTHELQKVAPVV